MNQISKEILAKKIRNLREASGKSQGDLGFALGKSHAAVSDIERGITELTVKDLNIIANFLGVSVIELLATNDRSHGTASFVQYRDGKDITPEEKKEADKSSQDFIKMARELAEQKNKK